MHCADNLVARQQYDQALDLPPVAEPDVITQITTPVGKRRGLEAGIISETGHQFLCIVNTFSIGQIWHVHALLPEGRRIFREQYTIVMPDSGDPGMGRRAIVNRPLGKCQSGTIIPDRDGWCPAMKHGKGKR